MQHSTIAVVIHKRDADISTIRKKVSVVNLHRTNGFWSYLRTQYLLQVQWHLSRVAGAVEAHNSRKIHVLCWKANPILQQRTIHILILLWRHTDTTAHCALGVSPQRALLPSVLFQATVERARGAMRGTSRGKGAVRTGWSFSSVLFLPHNALCF